MRILILLTLTTFAFAEPPAPYAPSGWKPQGRSFLLPTEQKQAQQPQQQYGPPKQQYGPPKQEYGPPKQEYGPPIKQELPKPEPAQSWQEYGPPPSIQPAISWQIPDDSPGRFLPNTDPINSWDQSQYGPPTEEPITITEEPIQEEPEADEQEETQRVLEQIRQYRLNVRRQQLRAKNQQIRQRANLRQNAQLQNLPRNYDVPQRNQRFQKQRVNNRFRSGRLMNEEEEQVTVDDQVNSEQGQGYDDGGYAPKKEYIPQRSYGLPSVPTQSTVPIARLAPVPEQTTTVLPETTTETDEIEEPEQEVEEEADEESDEPNIAVSNAVARNGQYYILQPNGRLQRVTYKTAQNPKNVNSPVVSNLRYENVNPIKDPIYSYANGQLVRINK